MAGANFVKGGRRDIRIDKKAMANNPAYPPSGARKKIYKQSEAQLKSMITPPGRIKVGVRVKGTESVEQLEIVGRGGNVLALTPAVDPGIAADLGTALGVAADEKWVTYRADWDPATFGRRFDTKLTLNPFECHPNGVRVFTIAITYDALSFTSDHYVYGVSVLPGENSQGLPIDVGAAAPAKKTAKKTSKKKTAKKAARPKKRK
ncbi:MAG: hypothetical protein A3I14_00285 [Candidatus Rokubacteria bacterium RIFCSPLOWO2_02_FULL_73_56]|nr:MAG: hypothetical protein A3I14_00285 [Candidatus Rokubacteria bacterium RIFCSPLOWO2_02_FULL_73_56]